METIFKLLLTLHITGGAAGLLSGTVNLVRTKGDRIHRIAGKIFTWGMYTTGFSAFALSIIHPNYFLFMVGVFTVYLVATGNRYLKLKTKVNQQRPHLTDWAISTSMLLAGILFIALGIKALLGHNGFGIVFIVFGSLGLLFVRTDLSNYRGKAKEKNYWLLAHLQRMTGGYIAALTAFLVVNARYAPIPVPGLVFWLLPTAILTPLIIRWTNRYRIKIKEEKETTTPLSP